MSIFDDDDGTDITSGEDESLEEIETTEDSFEPEEPINDFSEDSFELEGEELEGEIFYSEEEENQEVLFTEEESPTQGVQEFLCDEIAKSPVIDNWTNKLEELKQEQEDKIKEQRYSMIGDETEGLSSDYIQDKQQNKQNLM